jgi:hypothetical protein
MLMTGCSRRASLEKLDISPSHDFSEVIMRTIKDILNRLRGEYLEMPGLQLTAEQVQRLCGIEPKVCQSALDELGAR